MKMSSWAAVAAGLVFAIGGTGCADQAPEPANETTEGARQRVERLLSALSADSLEGRFTASPGALKAARIIGEELASYGVEPAGDSGFFQLVPFKRVTRRGRESLGLGSFDPDDPGAGDVVVGRNVLGVIRGSDPSVADQAIVVGAHFDHVGIRQAVDGDSIYNGADDDASGVVAVLEAARSLAAGPPPRRTVVFALFTGEELGLLGTRWYLDNPVVPLDQTVAELQVEMIGRPDSLAGGPGKLWLTGYERSTIGESLAAEGVSVVVDPRPDQDFFRRSDNFVFAVRGIPAHTLSSYGMHEDYHRPSDEVEMVDFDHMVAAVEAIVRSVRILADADEAPRWKQGGRPEP
ncbi:MAG: M20/M25/M40 family metallo-hydrolase, partial [Longimicrobiales bacterium]